MSDIFEQIKDTRATSGSVSSSFGTNSGYKLVLEWKRNSVDIANNKSNVTVTAYLQSSGSSYTINSSATKNGSFTINGTTYNFTFSASLSGSQKKQIASKTVDITHNSDGTKSFSLACTAGIQITFSSGYVASVSTSGTATLDAIPRTSSISVTSSVEAGKAVSITINRTSSSFTHKVYYTFGDKSVTISTSATTSASYTIPVDHCSVIPNSTSGTATIRCETFNGSTKVGETSKTFTVTVPSSVVPSFSSITCSPSGTDSSFGYVQGRTKLALAINGATGSYGSTIKSYKITGAGGTWNSQSVTTGVVNSTGSVTLTGTVTDSRGRTSASKTVTITVNAYHAPKITSWSVIRCNSEGTAQADGTYVKCTYNASISPLGNKNAKSYIIRSYQGGTQTASNSLSNTNYSISGSAVYSGYATDGSYTVQLEVKDSFSTTIQKVELGTAYMTMDFKKGGKGVAFGKVSEYDNMLDVNMKIRSFVHNEHKLGHYCWKASAGGGTGGWLKIASLKININYANSPIELHVSQRGRASISKILIQFANENNTDPALAVFYREGFISPVIHKSTTSTWDLYVQKSEGYDEICVNDIKLPKHMDGKVSVTWADALVSSLPSGYVSPTDVVKYDNLVFSTKVNAERRVLCEDNNAGWYWNKDGRVGMFDWKNGRTLMTYNITAGNLITFGSALALRDSYPATNSTYELGLSNNRWKTVYAVNALNTSDISYKENITYLGKSKSSNNVTHEDLHEFYRSRYKIATFNYKEQEHTEYGFITQDMYNDKVGETLIIKDKENGDMYSTGSYISSLAGALQYEINLRDKQIEKLENRLEKLEKLLESFVVTLDEK